MLVRQACLVRALIPDSDAHIGALNYRPVVYGIAES